jgi:hypothetical protein
MKEVLEKINKGAIDESDDIERKMYNGIEEILESIMRAKTQLSDKKTHISMPILSVPIFLEIDLVRKGRNIERQLSIRLAHEMRIFGDKTQIVDASYIGRCPICHDYFWASRKDQRGCSSSHSHALRSREARKKTSHKGK